MLARRRGVVAVHHPRAQPLLRPPLERASCARQAWSPRLSAATRSDRSGAEFRAASAPACRATAHSCCGRRRSFRSADARERRGPRGTAHQPRHEIVELPGIRARHLPSPNLRTGFRALRFSPSKTGSACGPGGAFRYCQSSRHRHIADRPGTAGRRRVGLRDPGCCPIGVSYVPDLGDLGCVRIPGASSRVWRCIAVVGVYPVRVGGAVAADEPCCWSRFAAPGA